MAQNIVSENRFFAEGTNEGRFENMMNVFFNQHRPISSSFGTVCACHEMEESTYPEHLAMVTTVTLYNMGMQL